MDINSLLLEITCTKMKIGRRAMNSQAFLVHTHGKLRVSEKSGVHYEIIRKHTQLYIDVDHKPTIETSDVIRAIDRKLQTKLAGFGIASGKPYVTRASSSHKGSAHMHYNVRFGTGYGLKTFMRSFVDDIKAGEDRDSLLLKAAGTKVNVCRIFLCIAKIDYFDCLGKPRREFAR